MFNNGQIFSKIFKLFTKTNYLYIEINEKNN